MKNKPRNMNAIAVLCQIRPDLQDVWNYGLMDYVMPSAQDVRDKHAKVLRELKDNLLVHDLTYCERCKNEFDIGDVYGQSRDCIMMCKRCARLLHVACFRFNKYSWDYRKTLEWSRLKPEQRRGARNRAGWADVMIGYQIEQMNRRNYR